MARRSIHCAARRGRWHRDPVGHGARVDQRRLDAARQALDTARAQRGWNGQPTGRLAGSGTEPGIGSAAPPRPSSRGSDAAARACRDARVVRRQLTDRRHLRRSGRAYMTSTRSATGHHAQVVGDDMIAPCPCSRFKSRIRSRICAWMVTSSAVVGSSAISSFGLQRQRHGDHHALAHAAGELVRIVVQARSSASGMPTIASSSIAALVRVRLATSACGARSASLICRLMVQDRVQRRHRILEDHRDVACRGSRRISSSVMRQQVVAVEEDLPADDLARAAAG